MAHPHRSKAHSSSKEKMRKLTGRGGGGSAHMGASHFKRAGKHGVLQSFDGHSKGYDGDHVIPQGRKKARADKFARGGRAKKKGDINVAIIMPHGGGGGGQQPPPRPAMPPPPPPPAPAAGGMPPPGARGMPQTPGGQGATGALQALAGKGLGFKRGGKVTSGAKLALEGDSKRKGGQGYDLRHWKNYAEKGKPAMNRASGGGVHMKAGAATGVGRLEQAHREKRRGKH